mmetsp:Transcript_95412/g.294348  ORF Transcript_95412/g.294348 Transcript_95412/m.294348 type:complete len:253 (+) Transcript_95412:2-760(+)
MHTHTVVPAQGRPSCTYGAEAGAYLLRFLAFFPAEPSLHRWLDDLFFFLCFFLASLLLRRLSLPLSLALLSESTSLMDCCQARNCSGVSMHGRTDTPGGSGRSGPRNVGGGGTSRGGPSTPGSEFTVTGIPAAATPAFSEAAGATPLGLPASSPPSPHLALPGLLAARCSLGKMKYSRSRAATESASRGFPMGVVSSVQGLWQSGHNSPRGSLKHRRQADRPQHRAMLGSSKMSRHSGQRYSGGHKLFRTGI